MNTQIDWHEELDSSFGRGPDLPAAQYVVSGRKAVRRRRLQTGAVGLATAAIVAGIGWAIAPSGAPQGADDSIANNPTSATSKPTAKASVERSVSAFPWRKIDPPARAFGPTGLEIREGAVIHERRDNLFLGKEGESVALDISFKGTRWWVSLEWDEGSGGGSSQHPGEMYDSFDEFVAAAIAQGGMTSGTEPSSEEGPSNLARLTIKDGLKLNPGVEALQQIENPLGLTAPESSLGVELRKDGVITWALLDAASGGGGGSYELAAQSGWLTLEQWVADRVALETGVPGLRLVTMDDTGMLNSAEPEMVITEHRIDPDLPAYMDESVTQSAIAEILWEGETWYVLVVRNPGGEDSVTTFAASKADDAETINQFVIFARARAEEGGGLR